MKKIESHVHLKDVNIPYLRDKIAPLQKLKLNQHEVPYANYRVLYFRVAWPTYSESAYIIDARCSYIGQVQDIVLIAVVVILEKCLI